MLARGSKRLISGKIERFAATGCRCRIPTIVAPEEAANICRCRNRSIA
jgi:hypothetical protein